MAEGIRGLGSFLLLLSPSIPASRESLQPPRPFPHTSRITAIFALLETEQQWHRKCCTRAAVMGNHGSNLDDILAEDMHHWYNKFMRESPSGLITLFELKAILGLQGMSEDANSYVDQVFFTFDMDGVRDQY